MTPVRLSELFMTAAAVADATDLASDPVVGAIVADSRQAGPGALFVAMPSATRDTHAFLPAVAEAGAEAAVVHSDEGFAAARALGMAAVLVRPGVSRGRFNAFVGRLCRAAYGDPTASMQVVGVTGTNGKTTTAWMVTHALRALGRRAAYLGTLGVDLGEGMRTLENTTPFPVELWGVLAEARDAGVDTFVMESSSHALHERRVAGVQYDVGAFTNLSQDHLDYHGTMEAYADSKKLLFTEYAAANGKPYRAAMNLADDWARAWQAELACPVYGFGVPGAELETFAEDVSVGHLTLHAAERGGDRVTARLGVGGLFNVENATTALAVLRCLGVPLAEAARGLEAVRPVPGRFEAVPNALGVGILVDYAHTPDALELLLKSARALNPSRLITVFGCGGDRDRTKRPKMAAAVSAHSDVTVVTSDNPRTEDPEAIIREILPGIVAGREAQAVTDRREAIFAAVTMAEPGDIVVIAGKGHEDYQIIGRTKHHMSDREMAREALEARSG